MCYLKPPLLRCNGGGLFCVKRKREDVGILPYKGFVVPWVQGRNPARFKGVFQGGKSKSPLEFVLLLCRKAKKIRVFYKLTTYVVVYGITFNHLITACGGASPQGEAFGLVRFATFDTKGRLWDSALRYL